MDLSAFSLGFSSSFIEAYNNTPRELLHIEGIAPYHLDVANMSNHYFQDRAIDMSIDDNANAVESKSYGNYLSEVGKGWIKLYGYYKLFSVLEKSLGTQQATNLIKSVWAGNLYINDSPSILVPYCWSYSTLPILFEGCPWGQLRSLKPHWRRSFMDQVKEVTIELAQAVAGAVAIGDLFVNYSYFVKKEGLNTANSYHRKDIENDFQSLVHTLNKKLRPSHQSPFTNLSIFDRPNLEKLFGDTRFPDGSVPDFELIEAIQHIFCDWFCKGDPITGLPYRFPIVTLNIKIDDQKQIIDKRSFEYYSKINLEKAAFNFYISSGNKIASCCRLINDLDLAGIDSFGNGGISLGSHRVVTINLARIGFLAETPAHFLTLLKEQLQNAQAILMAHRELLKENIAQGFLHFFNLGYFSLERMFSTIGLNGIYECLELLNLPINTKTGRDFAHTIFEEIKQFAAQASKETKNPFNIEQVPAESLAIKLAAKDKFLFNMSYELYSNQFIPLGVDCDIVDRIKLDGEFSQSLTGGGISHLNVGEKLTNKTQMEKLIAYAIECGCEHFAVNYNFCRCKQGHVSIAGVVKHCPICGEQIADYITRIVGYYVPVSGWTGGRQKEHATRKFNQDLFEQKSPIKEKNSYLLTE